MEGEGGHVCYLESRAAEKWLRSSSASVPSRIVYAMKHGAPSADAMRDAPPRGFLRERARVFDEELGNVGSNVPAAAAFARTSTMLQRVQVELNDVAGLRRRIQQRAVFAGLSPSLSSPSLSSPSSPPQAPPTPPRAVSGWYKEKQRAQGGKDDPAFLAQLAVFRSRLLCTFHGAFARTLASLVCAFLALDCSTQSL
jgi:hypothetical protein